ncbi:MAG TPA: patatin-like phospholipase family protein [Rhizomicrobium sp.]|nr:patatin-like phospholipase family protein [Rhizomicrobium sp.]
MARWARGSVILLCLGLMACVQERPDGITGCGQFLYGYNTDARADVRHLRGTPPNRFQFVAPDDPWFARNEDAFVDALVNAIGHIPARVPHTLNIISLSGGGQWGAYGAGFLNGWSRVDAAGWSPNDPVIPYLKRQDIDFVTGVSTGAMQTTLVLAGSADEAVNGIPAAEVRARADELLKQSYLDPRIGRLARQRNLLEAALFHNSLYDVSGLERVVRRTAADYLPVYEQLPPRKRAYVGTVDVDKGDFKVADLKAMADAPASSLEDARKSACISESILASAAIPIGFPPRFIERHMFVDGGTRLGLFSTIFLTHPKVQAAIQAANLKVYVSVIINGNQSSDSYKTRRTKVKNGLVDIAKASMSNGIDQIYKDSVYRTEMDLRMAFPNGYFSRYTYVSNREIRKSDAPDCIKSVRDQNEDEFDPTFMACLYKLGYDKALTGRKAWQLYDEIPAIAETQS